jgi:hypothetical protein
MWQIASDEQPVHSVRSYTVYNSVTRPRPNKNFFSCMDQGVPSQNQSSIILRKKPSMFGPISDKNKSKTKSVCAEVKMPIREIRAVR